jgi:eukaryotic-like serine/threonine-protein kinase
MSLAPGTKLGPYEIVSVIGAGGMGEVYRARDTRLNRTVAVKTLPAHFSSDPTRRQRFEREAKAISALNHANICTLHDVGSQDGIHFLVMEYVEGESLAQRLSRGPLPIDQVLKTAREIADALDRAHRTGIIHRDLKPGNIMMTKSGAKLLDFGLARHAAPAASVSTLTASLAQVASVTQEGMIVGTFQYMSPEQVEGRELDARSDIFSLGAVLYEMVTGQRAFEGKSQFSVASAILEKEPAPISNTKPLAPRSLDHVIRRCLAKDPEDRWQTARDLALELGSLSLEAPIVAGDGHVGLSRSRTVGISLGMFLAGLLVASAVLLSIYLQRNTSAVQNITRTSLLAPEGKEFDRWGAAALSPNGEYLVFSANVPGWGGQLWLRRTDSLTSKPLPGTEGAQNPFWSPDSKWIAFVAGGKLRKMSVDGGSPLVICDSVQERGGSWNSKGTILFVPGPGYPVYSVQDSGGIPVAVTELDTSAGEVSHRWPVFLPDGKHFLFLTRGKENAIYAASIGSKERKLILKNETNVVFVSSGYLLFVKNGTLMAQAFDAERLELKGNAIGIAEGVPIFGGQQRALFSVSENGLLAIHSKPEMLAQPTWIDGSGKVIEPLMEPAMFESGNMQMSPDGRKVAFSITDPKEGSDNIWIHNVNSHRTTRLTFEKFVAQHPRWSPDGNFLLFNSSSYGNPQILKISAAGIGEAELVFPSEYSQTAESWSPDGRYLIFRQQKEDKISERTLWVLQMTGEKKPYPLFAASHSQQWGATFSPDGRWVAYISNESGDPEIYVTSFPDVSTKVQISNSRGDRPRWSRDGRQLFYIGKDHEVMAATLRFAASGIEVTDPRKLFKLDIPEFEISGDGKRFLVFKVVDNQEPSTVTLIGNWTEILPKQ